ncbi:hypothetical protein K3495_g5448 [Podosphaera aphanis]|nr:hypothetical protein K3495_g5448 [Podosphaera aphanis]
MEFSREISPVNSNGGCLPPALLTPNSKIKALLAPLENSDDEPTTTSARDALLAQFVKSSHTKSSITASPGNINGSGENTSDEEDFIRPAAKRKPQNYEHKKSEASAPLSTELTVKSSEAENRLRHDINPFDSSDEDITPFTSRRKNNRTQRYGMNSAKSSPSSSLFVSPHKQPTYSNNTFSDSESLPEDIGEQSLFYASLRKKNLEQQMKEIKAQNDRETKTAEQEKKNVSLTHGEDENSEGVDSHFTPKPRVSRKASKKALEEINRETQRISRNQQFAHKAMTKKKFTKSSLFSKFNFRSKEEPEPVRPSSSGSTTPSTELKMNDTPPTSPISAQHMESNLFQDYQSAPEKNFKSQYLGEEVISVVEKNVENLSTDMKSEKFQKSSHSHDNLALSQSEFPFHRKELLVDDSDSDLEILQKTPTQKKRLDNVFDRVPAKQSREPTALHALKMLANIASPFAKEDPTKKSKISNVQLQIDLQQRARNQAIQEREERLALLRARGITIQTSEEMEKERSELDDMLSKAREEAEMLAKLEKSKTKGNFEDSINMINDTSDDEDYTETENGFHDDVSYSGSEEENDGNLDVDEDINENQQQGEKDLDKNEDNDLVLQSTSLLSDQIRDSQGHNESVNSLTNTSSAGASEIDEEIIKIMPSFQRRQKFRKKLNVISDDEDDSCLENQTPSLSKLKSPYLQAQSPATPCTVLRSATKPFIPGISVSGPAGLGLTQIFKGTMDESEVPSIISPEELENSNATNFSQRLPPPTFGSRMPTMELNIENSEIIDQSSISRIPDSQTSSLVLGDAKLCIPCSEMDLTRDMTEDIHTSETQGQTQDAGFVTLTPIEGRFVDGHDSNPESSLLHHVEKASIPKRKKLRRKRRPSNDSLDAENHINITTSFLKVRQVNDAEGDFQKMRKSATTIKRTASSFDKKQSAARDLINEQAEESEDEYAGLGGPSDDEAGSEDDGYMNDMIDDDDESGKNLNKTELAAFYADRERASDEKQIEKLYNDITKGMLRRRRGTDYDLSDSDDGGEALQRRKRKEFAKMRKALLADERISQIATNPKSQAFLQAIEDRCSEKETDFLHGGEEESTKSSQLSQEEIRPQNLTPSTSPSKRKFTDISGVEGQPAHREKSKRKPSNLSEIRESLSSLIDEPREFAASNLCSDSDSDLEIVGSEVTADPEKNNQNDNSDPFAPRQSYIHVIDRTSLKHGPSSLPTSRNSRLAFAPSISGTGLIVPPLLRRATTNNSIASGRSSNPGLSTVTSSTEREAGPVISGIKKGGTRGSGVNYFARENERRAKFEKSQKRREQKLFSGAMDRRRAVDGLLGGGKFE